jgi:hypothetical protein
MDVRIERDSLIKFHGITEDGGVAIEGTLFWKLWINSEYVVSSFLDDPREEFDPVIEVYRKKEKYNEQI